jgi:hypothetical protein
MRHAQDSATPVRRPVEASPDAVAAVLRNGWLYASWVVGASRIRGVDKTWPQVGASISHSVGLWPALISDRTTSLVDELPHRLELKARAWPAGEGHVVITVEPLDDPQQSLVSVAEWASAGPATVLPDFFAQPSIRYRNTEALRRLAMLAEARSSAEAGT